MRLRVATLASILLAGCGGESSDSSGPTAPPVQAPAPTPTPTPSPAPAPSPTPTSTPSPSPTPSGYVTFSEIYIYRLQPSVTLPSACGGFAFGGEPPAVLPVSAYGRGLSFRYVVTPQVWAIDGDVSIGFDGRDGDPLATGVEVGLVKTIGPNTFRFSIARPVAGGMGLDYARLASVSAPVQGVGRRYECLIGVPTLGADLTPSTSGAYPRTAIAATAHVREGSTTRIYSLDGSTMTIAADQTARRVTIALRLIGTPVVAGAPSVDLGAYTASGAIDPATGAFVADLAGGDRPLTGAVSGRFFGPQAVEVGAALSLSVPAAAGTPAFAVAGAVYGAR